MNSELLLELVCFISIVIKLFFALVAVNIFISIFCVGIVGILEFNNWLESKITYKKHKKQFENGEIPHN